MFYFLNKDGDIVKKFSLKILLLTAVLVLTVMCPISTSAATYITDGKDFYLAFDYNQDGLVDIRDLVNIKKSIANGKTTSAQDINGDGSVDSSDMVYLRKHLLGIDNSAWTEAF